VISLSLKEAERTKGRESGRRRKGGIEVKKALH